MTNTLELELALKRSGKTKREIAKALGLSEMGLHNKIRNESEFKASEIASLSDLLCLTVAERDNIFFYQKM